MEKVWTRKYEINSFLINSQKKLGIYFLLNLIQDAAWSHASQHGYGQDSNLMGDALWVLTRQALIMEQWPTWGQEVEMRTWIRPPHGPYIIRDFEMFCEGKKIGECSTSWLMLHSQTRKPLKDNLKGFEALVQADRQVKLETPKIELQTNLESLAQFEVRNSDLDMNQHVNNTKYVQWILDSLPQSTLFSYRLHEYQVNFLAETKSNDVITIQRARLSEPESNQTWIQFQGFRESDQKFVFVAKLRISQL